MAHARHCRCIAILSVVHTHTHTQHTHTHTHTTHTTHTQHTHTHHTTQHTQHTHTHTHTHTHYTQHTTIICTCPGGSSDGSDTVILDITCRANLALFNLLWVAPEVEEVSSEQAPQHLPAPPTLHRLQWQKYSSTHSQGSPPESTCPAAWHMQDIADV